MKKFLIGLAVFVVVVGVIAATRRSGKNEEPARPTVVVVKADVSIKLPGATAFSAVSDTARVSEGTEIKTSVDGMARLEYPNGTVTSIDGDTVVKITALDETGGQSRLSLLGGSILSKIERILGTGEYYEVETENVVASVRGTIFGTEYRDRVSRVYGIENTVKVRTRDPKVGKPIEGSEIDVKNGEKASVSSADVLAGIRSVKKEALAAKDFQSTFTRGHTLEDFKKEDLKKDQVRGFIRKVREHNEKDTKFIQKMRERGLINGEEDDEEQTPTPNITRPTASPTPTPSVVTETPSPTPTPTPTPSPEPTLESVTPKTVSPGASLFINGTNFTKDRNISQIKTVRIGTAQVSFSVIDAQTLFVTAPAQLGIYDVGIVTASGTELVLPKALTVQ